MTAEPTTRLPTGEYLGGFQRAHVKFAVLRTAPDTYRVDCDDGVGPREVCTFTSQRGSPPVWRGAWNGDAWCSWILAQARRTVRNAAE